MRSHLAAGSSEAMQTTMQVPAPVVEKPVDGSDMMFVTWYATGGHGDGGFRTHQFHKPDMRCCTPLQLPPGTLVSCPGLQLAFTSSRALVMHQAVLT